jgi:enoyl-CoA hydratase / long-chain 3-hydroxyacyl-CoA dehydrogenase
MRLLDHQAKLAKRRMTKFEYDSTNSRVVPLTDESASWAAHAGKADLVIEAVFEEISLKHKVIKQVGGANEAQG